MTGTIKLVSFSVREGGEKGLILQETRCPLPKPALKLAVRLTYQKDA